MMNIRSDKNQSKANEIRIQRWILSETSERWLSDRKGLILIHFQGVEIFYEVIIYGLMIGFPVYEVIMTYKSGLVES